MKTDADTTAAPAVGSPRDCGVGRLEPERVQLSRRPGWRMPPNTVKVARPSAWGNPFVVGKLDHATGEVVADRAHAARLFDLRWFHNGADPMGVMLEEVRRDLRGKNLACWCRLDQPCHADVLLKYANSEPPNA